MDYQIRWSPEAVEDIEEITAYIHKDSPLYAQKVVEELIAAARRLTQFPLRGRQVPELTTTHRECFVYSYRMIYRVIENTVRPTTFS
ncbi:MAG: type II toxin-antitoxin system RelE/ParE family toxin [Sulfuricaulis sp.]